MKSLDTGKLYVKDLFSKPRFYRVPDYQRPYVWETQQIHDLLNDISGAMDADKYKEYFLGCMIWNIVSDRMNNYEFDCHDILDGQQRFITLFLLHAVIRDRSEDRALKTKVESRLKQKEDRFDNVPARNRIYFAIREDKAFLDQWVLEPGKTGAHQDLKQIAVDGSRPISVRNMAAAIVDIGNWWEQKLADMSPENGEEYLGNFFAYLSNKVLALFLATPDNLDDAYNLFTVLNSRGVKLRAGDILRAQNLRVINDNLEKREELAKAWDRQVDSIRSPLKSFDELLKIIMLARIKFNSDQTKSLHSGFEYLVRRQEISYGEPFFELVRRYATHFQAVSQPEKLGIQPKKVTYFENIYFILAETFGSQFMMPLLHFVEVFGRKRVFEFLVKLDNLVSMAWLLGLRTGKTRMFILVRQMDETAKKFGPTDEGALKFLAHDVLRYDYDYKKSKTAMAIGDLKDHFHEERWGSYIGQRLNKTRYLLLKLDMLHGNSQTKLSFNRAASSVEHIYPRKPKQLTLGESPEWHQEWVHRLGNLVLLDRKKNSSLGNLPFSDKKKKFQRDFESRPYTTAVFIKNNEWGRTELEAQHRYAVDTLAAYYEANSADYFNKT